MAENEVVVGWITPPSFEEPALTDLQRAALEDLERKTAAEIARIREWERLSHEDFSVYINAIG